MSAIDELWLICGVSPAEIERMPLARVGFWHRRAVTYFNASSATPAPKSAVAQQQTQQIAQYVRALRGG